MSLVQHTISDSLKLTETLNGQNSQDVVVSVAVQASDELYITIKALMVAVFSLYRPKFVDFCIRETQEDLMAIV